MAIYATFSSRLKERFLQDRRIAVSFLFSISTTVDIVPAGFKCRIYLIFLSKNLFKIYYEYIQNGLVFSTKIEYVTIAKTLSFYFAGELHPLTIKSTLKALLYLIYFEKLISIFFL